MLGPVLTEKQYFQKVCSEFWKFKMIFLILEMIQFLAVSFSGVYKTIFKNSITL